MSKVVNLADCDTSLLFELSQYMLGDKDGKWIVLSDEGYPLGRYVNKDDALEHSDRTQDNRSDMTTQELLQHADKLIAEAEDFLGKLNED